MAVVVASTGVVVQSTEVVEVRSTLLFLGELVVVVFQKVKNHQSAWENLIPL